MARSRSAAKSTPGTKSTASSNATPATMSTPTTRRTAPAAAVNSEPRKARRSRAKEESIKGDAKGQQISQADEAVEPEQKAEDGDGKQERKQDVVRQEVGRTEAAEHDGHGDESSRVYSYSILPGALSPFVDTSRAMSVVAVSAITSSAVSLGCHMLVDWVASTSAPPWATWTSYAGAMAMPSALSPISALGIRICKLALAWGRFSNVIALDVLAYAPIVYLFASFYNVPLSAALVSAAIDLAADTLPLPAWKWLANSVIFDDDDDDNHNDDDGEEDEDNQEDGKGEDEAAVTATMATDGYGNRHIGTSEVLRDPVTFACSAAFAGALYSFTFVQACRLFLPRTFVVHFMGIATVEPARALPISATFPPSAHELGAAVFLSWPAVLLALVCGVAAYSFIFADVDILPPSSPGYKKTVASRALSLSLVVGTNIFLQCFIGVRGIDVVGAVYYASIWAAAPLLVGAALGLARS